MTEMKSLNTSGSNVPDTRDFHAPESIRCFFSVSVEPGIIEMIRDFQKCLGKCWRPASESQLHITLAFMGSVPVSQVKSVIEAGRNVAEQFGPLNIHVEGLGAFPNMRSPRVLFVGIRAPGLSGLVSSLRGQLEDYTDNSKPFRPHLTLARAVNTNRNAIMSGGEIAEWEERRSKKLTRALGWSVRHFELIKSELHRSGARHEKIADFQLK